MNRIFIAFLLLTFPAATGHQLRCAEPPSKSFHTHAELVADVSGITPGATFTAGILLKMDPGWHTYWKNGGDAGLPTKLRWDLPPGFKPAQIEWPVPEKQIETGDLLTFGYTGETMLLVPVSAPEKLPFGKAVTLKANVQWLECEHVCVPGNAEVQLSLPVLTRPAQPANGALFDRYRALIPKPLSPDADIAVTAATSGNMAVLSVAPRDGESLVFDPGVVPDFYPEQTGDLSIGRVKASRTVDGATLQVPLEAYERPAQGAILRGVVLYRLAGKGRGFAELSIPLSREFCASLPLAGAGATEPGVLERQFEIAGDNAAGQPLAIFVVFALIGGLLLNIMPCVLPVIALKIFGLVRMAGDRPGRVKKLGWAFSSGILASFLLLATLVIILKLAGSQVGWGFQFQEPLFVIAMSAVVFAFGLSLFGVYEIQLPGAATSGVGNVLSRQAEGGGGYLSSFTEGVFATILATPCTAPFLGAALGFAFSQSAAVILLIFASVAVGMALPYLILTARPSWLKFLPKPGGWMVTAKEFMGFLMMATLVWLLYILGKELGMEAVIWTIAFLLTVGVACWLIGKFATLSSSRARRWSVWAAALLVVAGGYWVFLDSALDIFNVVAGTPPLQGEAAGNAKEQGIPWKPFSLSGLDADLGDGKPVFIDFTADWCLTCKVNERAVLSDQAVVRKFKELHVIPIRADWTNRNPDITKLMAKFGRSGVPLYVIFPAGKPNAPIVLPEVVTTDIVVGALERAAAPPVSQLSRTPSGAR